MSQGDYVTPREFYLMNQRMDGFEHTLGDISKDVKSLLAVHNREEGGMLATAIVSKKSQDSGARRIAIGSFLVSALAAISSYFGSPHHL